MRLQGNDVQRGVVAHHRRAHKLLGHCLREGQVQWSKGGKKAFKGALTEGK